MPRKFIKKHMPNEDSFRKRPALKWLSKYINSRELWRLNRRSVSRGVGVGIFCALLPLPLQMLVAAVLAIFLRSNLMIAVGLVWITNPLTMAPIFYFTYKIGTLILGTHHIEMSAGFGYEYLMAELASIWLPLITGSLVCATTLSLLSYAIINIFWVWNVKNAWKKRRFKRKD